MAIYSNTQKMSLLLGGRVVSIKDVLISSTIKRCFSSSLHRSATTNPPLSTSAWLMVPPTLVADHSMDLKHCPHCKKIVGSVDRSAHFKVKSNSELKPEDNDYHYFLNAADCKIVFKKRKNLWMPWQTDQLSPDEVICIGSSHGWLAYIHQRNCSLYIYNPFTDSSLPYLPLPPIETLPPVMSSRRLNGMHIDSSASSSSSVVTEFTLWRQMTPISAKDLAKELFRKLVMSSAPITPNHYHNADQDSQTIVMAIYQDRHPSRLAFCRIGDTSWTALNSPLKDSYSDVLYFSKKKLFYALCNHGSIESWDLTNPSSPKRSLSISKVPYYSSSDTRYLVESLGDLLTVSRHDAYYPDSDDNIMTSHFRVYKWDFDDNKWVRVTSLGDRLLFVGQNHAVSLSAHDIPGLTKNSVYFTSEYLEMDGDVLIWGCLTWMMRSFIGST